MSIFSRKPVKPVREQAPQVLLLPLSAHEATELVEVLTAIRSGDQMRCERALMALQRWDIQRSLVVMGTLGERYIKYLIDAKVVQLHNDADGGRTLVEKLRGSIPQEIRPSEEVMFDAVVLATSSGNSNVRRRVGEDTWGALIGLAYLCAAGAGLTGEGPGRKPNVAEMLHGIAAPW
jgi:hypothetical protein